MPPKIRVWRHDRPRAGLTIERDGREREVGPRGRLTLDEAAAVLERPVSEVRRDVRAGFLVARRHRGRVVVTLAACDRFLREERADGEGARAALEEMRRTGAPPIPAEVVYRELGLE